MILGFGYCPWHCKYNNSAFVAHKHQRTLQIIIKCYTYFDYTTLWPISVVLIVAVRWVSSSIRQYDFNIYTVSSDVGVLQQYQGIIIRRIMRQICWYSVLAFNYYSRPLSRRWTGTQRDEIAALLASYTFTAHYPA